MECKNGSIIFIHSAAMVNALRAIKFVEKCFRVRSINARRPVIRGNVIHAN